MTLPHPVQYGTVSYNALAALADGLDADPRPDALPPRGTVTFTASRSVVTVAGGEEPFDLFLTPVSYDIGDDGIMRDAEGRDAVSLIATDSEGLSHINWTWTASFRFDGVNITRQPITFALPAGSHVNLSAVDPIDEHRGVPVIRGPQGLPGVDGSQYPQVIHGDNPDVDRPITDKPVTWLGSVLPNNGDATKGDTWIPVYDAETGVGGAPSVPDATDLNKGLVRLAGDLGGTADSPTVPALAGLAPIAHLNDPTTTTGRAIRSAIGQFGTKVTAIGNVRLWAPGSSDPTGGMEDGDLFVNIGPRAGSNTPGLKVYVGGQWVLVAGAVAGEEPEPQPDPVEPTLTMSATAGDRKVTVRTSVVQGTNGITVTHVRLARQGADASGNQNHVVTVPVSINTSDFTNLVNGTTYTFSAQMLDGAGNTVGALVTATATPAGATNNPNPTTPTTLTVSGAPGDGRASLSWSVTPGTDLLNVTGVLVGRNGTDTNGSGPWSTTETSLTGSRVFDKLINGTEYTLSADMVVGGVPQGSPKTVRVTPVGGATNPDPVPGGGGGATPSAKFSGLVMPARGWFSGGAGSGIDNNSTGFGDWRGDRTDAQSNWIDTANGAAWGAGIGGSSPSGPAANFTGLLDIAIGGPSDYNAARNGSLDGQLRTLLRNIRRNRIVGGVLRPTVIRPFHECNGNWYPWSVYPGGEANFRATARRWRAIADEEFPEAIWALCGNGETTSGIQFANLYEDGVWDAIGADRYNAWPYIGTSATGQFTSWENGSTQGSDSNPKGAETWRRFAQNRGLPIYFPEYANPGHRAGDAQTGNDPYWVTNWFAWVKAHAGKGPGQVFAEMWFNISPGQYDDKYWLWNNGTVNPRQGAVATAYRDIFPA